MTEHLIGVLTRSLKFKRFQLRLKTLRKNLKIAEQSANTVDHFMSFEFYSLYFFNTSCKRFQYLMYAEKSVTLKNGF